MTQPQCLSPSSVAGATPPDAAVIELDAPERDALRDWARVVLDDYTAVRNCAEHGRLNEARDWLARWSTCVNVIEQLGSEYECEDRERRYELTLTPDVARFLAYVESQVPLELASLREDLSARAADWPASTDMVEMRRQARREIARELAAESACRAAREALGTEVAR